MTIDAPRADQISALRRLWRQAFGDTDEFLDGFFSTGFSPARCQCVTFDGKTVAALYWFDCRWETKQLAYIYAVATDEAYRGQGLCRQLMEDTHTCLQKQGYAGAVLVPGSKQLFDLYEKLGYRAFCPMVKDTVAAGGDPLSIDPISPEDYARLRRLRLPADGILQEGETLTFLHTFARFYSGPELLFCAARDEDTVYFQEYWGDPANVPRILTALGAKKGVIRLPGGVAPFAMYRSLDGDPDLPGYLGLALD